MNFNSATFAAFFAVVYLLYLLLRGSYRRQNMLLLVASYVFYGTWNAKFLLLLAGSTVVDFAVARRLAVTEAPRARKALLAVSVVVNLSLLGFFKYFNFFAASAADLLGLLGLHADFATLNIILPVGISFYTFQTLSYTIDVYRRQLEPARSFLDFALYVSFFPQLVAGPIERSTRLMPQITAPRRVTATDVNAAIYLLLWGYFKKMVIADNVAVVANEVFNHHTQFYGVDLWLGALAFAVQIYCDFSAYSDIARGVSRLMGFNLMVNFRQPYFAVSPSDFWNRWHISLSSWLRDYLYIPLGGNRKGPRRTQINLMTTMLLGGLWHGAAWNFVLWGAYQGGILALYRQLDRNPLGKTPWTCGRHPLEVLLRMGLMFALTLVGWVFFRAESVGQIGYFLREMVGGVSMHSARLAGSILFYTWPLAAMELYAYVRRNQLAALTIPTPLRWAVYGLLLFACVSLSNLNHVEFIYFQF